MNNKEVFSYSDSFLNEIASSKSRASKGSIVKVVIALKASFLALIFVMIDLDKLLLIANQNILTDLVTALKFIDKVRGVLSYVLNHSCRYQIKSRR